MLQNKHSSRPGGFTQHQVISRSSYISHVGRDQGHQAQRLGEQPWPQPQPGRGRERPAVSSLDLLLPTTHWPELGLQCPLPTEKTHQQSCHVRRQERALGGMAHGAWQTLMGPAWYLSFLLSMPGSPWVRAGLQPSQEACFPAPALARQGM